MKIIRRIRKHTPSIIVILVIVALSVAIVAFFINLFSSTEGVRQYSPGYAANEDEVTNEEFLENDEIENEETTTDEETTTEDELAKVEWESYFEATIEALKLEFPDGKYWNHVGISGYEASQSYVTDTPCNHDVDGTLYCNIYRGQSNLAYPHSVAGRQCLGFASMLSDRIYGTGAAAEVFYDYDELQPGDQARIYSDSHTVLILEKTDEYVTVAECNADYQTCKIAWGRKIRRSVLESGWFIRRVTE